MTEPLHVHFEDLEIGQVIPLGACAVDAEALDVFAEEPTAAARWAGVPNTVLTPHTGGATTEAVQGMLVLLLQNLSAHFAGEPLKTPVGT